MKIIDFHTHLQARWFDIPLLTDDAFIAGMDRCEVQLSCIFTMMGFYGNCPQENDQLAAYARAHPQRLVPFLTVDPKLGTAAVDEAERCLKNPLFRGIKFHPWLQAWAPSMVRDTLTKILQLAARYDVPVIFHDGTPPYSTTFQIAVVARLVPETKIVLGHGGLADYVYPAGQLLRKLPNLYACCCAPKPGDIRYLVEMAGEDRVLFGSDFGISNWHILAERLDDVFQSELPPATAHKVLYENAARLLHLKNRPLS